MIDDAEKFLKIKDAILNNLATLKFEIMDCVEIGMPDPGDELYNEITTVIEDASMIDVLEELENMVYRGQQIERKIDLYLSSLGRMTLALKWPAIKL